MESRAILGRNQTRVVERGREPGLQLEGESGLIGLQDWATTLFDACEPIAAALDKASGMSASKYLDSLGQQRQINPPSAYAISESHCCHGHARLVF